MKFVFVTVVDVRDEDGWEVDPEHADAIGSHLTTDLDLDVDDWDFILVGERKYRPQAIQLTEVGR